MFISDKIKLRDNNFDFLRFLAATLVIFSHSFALTGRGFEPYLWLTGYATFGTLVVNIFFVLSGFLITKSWLDNPGVIVFLKKRILRIMPGLFVAVVFTILVIGPLVTSLNIGKYFLHPMTREYFKNAFLSVNFFLPGVFTDNIYKGAVNGSLWTLPVEFKLYILVLVFGIVKLFQKRILVLLAGMALLSLVAINLYSPTLYSIGQTDLDFLRLAVYFFMGILFYLYRDKIIFSKYIFSLALIVLLASFKLKYGLIISFLVLPYIILYIGLFKIKALNIFSKYGDFSYGLYIYAFPVQQTIAYLSKNKISTIALFFFAFIVTLLLAVCSWNFVEQPFIKLKSIQFRVSIKQYFLRYFAAISGSINENV